MLAFLEINSLLAFQPGFNKPKKEMQLIDDLQDSYKTSFQAFLRTVLESTFFNLYHYQTSLDETNVESSYHVIAVPNCILYFLNPKYRPCFFVYTVELFCGKYF